MGGGGDVAETKTAVATGVEIMTDLQYKGVIAMISNIVMEMLEAGKSAPEIKARLKELYMGEWIGDGEPNKATATDRG
jgi:microcompartment protein CcmL/EutN